MSANENSSLCLWVEMSNDIGRVELCAIPACEICLLCLYLQAKSLELIYYPFFAEVMRLTVHRAWTEVALCLTISHC